MNSVVDERTLKMNFDNSNFERNVSSTMSTLDKLKSKLKMKGAASGLDDVAKSTKKIDFKGVSSGIETASSKLISFGDLAKTIIGVDIIRYLENMASKFASAITIDPLKDGLSEYENQINAVQTIMANTGSDVKSVNATLDDLNRYADKTIYNFGQMTRNMGTFTAAMGTGSLEESAEAIKGIGNWAAYAGTNAEDMARATYQLSQALSTGSIKLMDWKSIENTGGMAGQNFQEAFKETAREFGIDVDSMIEANGNFRESLKEGWLTTDVFLATMKKFAENEDMTDAATKVKTFSQLIDTAKEALGSGWAQVFRTVIGGFEEAKAFWTKVADVLTGDEGVITKFFNVVNALTENVFQGNHIDLDELTGTLDRYGISMDEFEKHLKKVTEDYGGKGSWEKTLEGYSSVGEALKDGAFHSEIFKDAMVETLGTVEKGGKVFSATEEELKKFSDMADRVINGDFGNGEERIKKLTKAGWDYQKVQNIVNKKCWGQKVTIDDLTGSQEKSAELTKEQTKAYQELADQINDPKSDISKLIDQMTMPTGRELLIDSIANSWHTIASLAGTVKDAFSTVFDTSFGHTAGKIYEFVYKIGQTTRVIADEVIKDAPRLKNTLSGVFAIFKFGLDILKMAEAVIYPLVFTALYSLKEAILDIGDAIGPVIVKWVKWFEESDMMYKIVLNIDTAILYLQDRISKLFSKLGNLKSVQTLLGYGLKLINAIYGKVKEFFKFLTDNEAFTKFLHQLDYVFSNLDDYIVKGVDSIAKFLNKLFSGTLDLSDIDFRGFFDKVFENLGKLAKAAYYDGLKGIKETLSKFGKEITETLGLSLSTSMESTGIGKLKEGIGKIFERLKEFFGEIDFSKIMSWLLSGGFVGAIYKMGTALTLFGKAAENFSQAAVGLGNLLTNIGKVPAAFATVMEKSATRISYTIKQFGKMLKGIKWKMYSEAILTFSKSLLVLVGALAILTALAYYGGDSFWQAIVSLQVIVIMLGLIAVTLGELAKITAKLPTEAVSLIQLAGSLALVAGAIFLVASSVAKLAKLGVGQIVQGLLGVGIIIGAFAAIVAAFTLIPAVKLPEIVLLGNLALKLAASMALMAVVIRLCGGITEEQAKKAIGVASGMLVFIGLLNLVTRKYSLVGSDLGTLMMKLSVAMGLMVVVTKMAGGISDKAMIQMAKMASGFLVFIGILSLITRNAVTAGKIGGVMAGVGVAIYLMAISTQTLGQMDIGQLAKGVTCVTLFGVICGMLLAIIGPLTGGSIGMAATMIAVSTAIAIMGAIAIILGLIPLENLVKGVAAVTMLGLVTAAILAAIGTIPPEIVAKATGVLFALGVFCGVLGVIVWILANSAKPEGVAAAGIAMGVLVAAMALMAFCSKFATVGLNALGGIAVALVCVAALGVLFYYLSDKIDPIGALSAAGAISGVLIAMSAALAIMAIFGHGVGVGAIGGILVLAGVVAVLGYVLYQLRDLNPQAALTQAIAIGALILALSVAMVPLAVAGGAGVAALVGAAILLVFILVCGALAAGLGALESEFPSIKKFINEGGPLLIEMAEIAGKVIGAFVGGVIGQFAESSLTGIARGLSNFMIEIQPFILGCRAIKEDDFKNVGALTSAINSLTGASFLNSLASLVGLGDFEDFGVSLVNLGKALNQFGTEMMKGGVDPVVLKNSALAAKYLGEFLDNIPRTGGWTDTIFGTINWEEFGRGIVGFGNVMIQFGKYFSGESKSKLESIQTAAKAGKAIAEMADEVPNQGGLWGWIAGDTDWKTINEGIKGYGEAIRIFANTVLKNCNIPVEEISKAVEVGKSIASMASDIPNEGGVWGFFTGDTDWKGVSDGIKGYGEAIRVFGQNFTKTTVNAEQIKQATEAGKAVAKMADEMPTSGGLWGWLAGDDISWKDISEGLKYFGEAISTFYTKTLEIDLDSLKLGIKAGELLAKFAGKEDLISTKGWILDTKIDFNNLKDNLTAVGSCLNTFALVASTVEPSKIQNAINCVKLLLNFGSQQGVLRENILTTDIINFDTVKKNIAALAGALNQFNLISNTTNFQSISVASVGASELGNIGRSVAEGLPYFQHDFSPFVQGCKELSIGIKSFHDNTVGMNEGTVLVACNSLNDIVDVAKNIGTTTADPIVNFINGLQGIATDGAQKFLDAFNMKCPDAIDVAIKFVQSIIEGMNDKERDLEATVTNLMEGALEILKKEAPESKQYGTQFGKSFADGLLYTEKDVYNACGTLIKATVNAISSGEQDAYNAGVNVGRGLANGLQSVESTVYNAATRISNLVNDAIRKAQQIHSPSRVQEENGEYIGLGLIKGLKATFTKLTKTGEEAAKSANYGITRALRDVGTMFTEDIDSQPVIRPVIDLTNIEDGAKQIKSLSSITPTVGLSANIRSFGSIRQNGIYSNDDVVSAVNGLSARIDQLQPSNTYNVNGVTYDDGTNVASAVGDMIRAIRIERRI